MSQALRKLTAAMARTNTAIIFINQLRQKIGVVYGNPETTTGGDAAKFYASVRLDIHKIGMVKNGEQVVGTRARVRRRGSCVAHARPRRGAAAPALPVPFGRLALLGWGLPSPRRLGNPWTGAQQP